MKLLLNRFAFLGLNKKRLTETDFHNICTREGITITESVEHVSFWATVDGFPHIVLSKHLKGSRRLFTMWHEIGHHFLDSGRELNAIHFADSGHSKEEFEANAFATIALCPRYTLFDNFLINEIDDGRDVYLEYVYRERKRLWFLYGE